MTAPRARCTERTRSVSKSFYQRASPEHQCSVASLARTPYHHPLNPIREIRIAKRDGGSFTVQLKRPRSLSALAFGVQTPCEGCG
ncbi:hypothetical protein Q31a_35070 [Aureliella helgolandensis]|uniref:Uncharacterized protein n=1 Tax=Aureliella helgolandensis TaxID=2527968 RepID=A0A518G9B0_9BACT|nr:hypothetical protein Q31a_35070 [Aureliella helgolandensis]